MEKVSCPTQTNRSNLTLTLTLTFFLKGMTTSMYFFLKWCKSFKMLFNNGVSPLKRSLTMDRVKGRLSHHLT